MTRLLTAAMTAAMTPAWAACTAGWACWLAVHAVTGGLR